MANAGAGVSAGLVFTDRQEATMLMSSAVAASVLMSQPVIEMVRSSGRPVAGAAS